MLLLWLKKSMIRAGYFLDTHMSQNIIYQWIKSDVVKPAHRHAALVLAGERADGLAWLGFISRLLVLLGLLSLAVGVVFFFAYNWNDMGRMVKFAVLQVILVLTFVTYHFKSGSPWLAQALLLTGVIVLGALLALFGQTYQTGADPWQLFATWAALITPLVLFSRSEALWVFWAVLINTALVLYLQVNRSFLWLPFTQRQSIWLFLLVNTALLVWYEWLASERLSQHPRWGLSHRWAAQVMGLVVLYILSWIGLESLFGRDIAHVFYFFVYVLLMSGVFWYYRYRCADLLLLTAWCLAVMVFVLSFLGNHLLDSLEAGSLLLMAISLIGMSTWAVSWIKKTHQQLKAEEVA